MRKLANVLRFPVGPPPAGPRVEIRLDLRLIRFRRPPRGELWAAVYVWGRRVGMLPLEEDLRGPKRRARWPRPVRALPPKPWPRPRRRRVVPLPRPRD